MVDGIGSSSGVQPPVTTETKKEDVISGAKTDVQVDLKATKDASSNNRLAQGFFAIGSFAQGPKIAADQADTDDLLADANQIELGNQELDDVDKLTENFNKYEQVAQTSNANTPQWNPEDSVELKNQKAAETLIVLADIINTDGDNKISKEEVTSLLNNLKALQAEGEGNQSVIDALEYLVNDESGQKLFSNLDQLDGRRVGRGGLINKPRTDGQIDISKLTAKFGTDIKVLNELKNIETPVFNSEGTTAEKNEQAGKTLLALVDVLNTEPNRIRVGRGSMFNTADSKISKAEVKQLLTTLNELSDRGYEVNDSVKEALDYLLNDEEGKKHFDNLDGERVGRGGGVRIDGQIDVARLEREYGTQEPTPPVTGS